MAGKKKTKYMASGKKTKYMASGKKTKYMASGKMTGKVEHYKDYVKRMFGGGMTSAPAMKKKRLNFKDGGITKTQLSEKELKGLQNAGVSKNEIDAMRGKKIPTVTTVGKKRKRPLDGKRSRGRKYDRSHAGTSWSD